MVSWRPFLGLARSERELTVTLVQPSSRGFQPSRMFMALPWRVARRR